MKRGIQQRPGRPGLTLMEAVIAIGIVAMTVPLLVVAMGASVKSRRNAEFDTRAAWIAGQVVDEVRNAWRGGESIFAEQVPAYPVFPGGGDKLYLLYDTEGKFAKISDEATCSAAVTTKGVGYVVTLEGLEHRPAGLTLATPMSKLRVVVEAPAQALPAQRAKHMFLTIRTQEGGK
jgi:type II secretory pathway pseudopilin PulG